MSEYSKLTVAQLKEILTQRSLPLDGLKNDLIKRLEQDDESPKQTVETKTAEQPEIETKVIDSKEDVIANTEPTLVRATEQSESKKIENNNELKKEEEIKPELTKEEITKMALDLLNKKLYRAKKFSLEQSEIDSIEKSINRIEKFGVNLQSPLAIELGLVKKPSTPINQQKKNKDKNNGRINKNNNGNKFKHKKFNKNRGMRY